MRILVSGVGGFVGPHLVRELEASGHAVWGASLSAVRENLLPAERLFIGDLARPGHWDRVLGESEPEAVIHLASQSNPALSWEIPRETFDANVQLTIDLIEAAGRLAVRPRVIVVSSSDVYGIPPDGAPLSECSPLRPTTPYGASKIAAEQCARLYGERVGVPVTVARPFSHTGPGQTTRFVVPAFARQIALVEAGLAKRVDHGDLESNRDFCDVRDVVRAYRLLAEGSPAHAVYNICSGQSRTVSSLLSMLLSMTKSRVPTHFDARRGRSERASVVRGDASRLREEFGWQPQVPFEQTLRDVLEEQRRLILHDDRKEN